MPPLIERAKVEDGGYEAVAFKAIEVGFLIVLGDYFSGTRPICSG